MPAAAQAGTLVGRAAPYTGSKIQAGDYLMLWLLGLADFWLTPGQDAFLSGIVVVASSPGGGELLAL